MHATKLTITRITNYASVLVISSLLAVSGCLQNGDRFFLFLKFIERGFKKNSFEQLAGLY